jgi:hypothetical protein
LASSPITFSDRQHSGLRRPSALPLEVPVMAPNLIQQRLDLPRGVEGEIVGLK